ncbi:MAG TPA: glycosyltransferase family 4 protein [Acidimicrobiia bacterium]
MSLQIGMLAPITHPYPPDGYGPWERVTYDLVESLVAAGHDVTLFAAEDSRTAARLHATTPAPLTRRPDTDARAVEDEHIRNALVACSVLGVDVLHSHLHVHVLERADLWDGPIVSTLHGVAWDPAVRRRLDPHAHRPFVSLSDSERRFHPGLNWVATVPNGIATEELPPGPGGGGYVAFVGRLAPEKAPHLAIEAARRAGVPIVLAGIIEEKHRRYADRVLEMTDGDQARYLGPLDRPDLVPLLQNAEALLMPLEWDEPFGLVVVESLACGTPVVAWRRGAMSEIVEEGRTGYLVDDVESAGEALARITSISRDLCAHEARRRFDRTVMAAAYAEVYRNVSSSLTGPRRAG